MNTPPELSGWVLSVYPDEVDGAVLWLLGEDGERCRLTQEFKTTFYLGGERGRLHTVQAFLASLDPLPATNFVQREDLYKGSLLLLAVQVANPIAQQRMFYLLKKKFKWLRYYDAKIPFPIRYGVAKNVFPMARCRVQTDGRSRILGIQALDSPWDLEYGMPSLRTLVIEPDANPNHAPPKTLTVAFEGTSKNLSLKDEKPLLLELQAVLDDYDPDVIFALWGDGWLFPHLLGIAEKHGLDFNPNRDKRQRVRTIEEMTFESYGSIYFRAAQTHLFGRWHIDSKNSTMDMGFNFSMRSAIEMARVTSVSVQTAARNSPGSGFTAMQIREALNRGILVPLHKRQTERFKSALELNAADGGGLNYRPVVGVHQHVAELDFFSMYPSIMESWNISGETVGVEGEKTKRVPQNNMPIRQDVPGLVASVLRPLLKKRYAVKQQLKQLDQHDPGYPVLQSISDALKWLGYVSFGYQGYKNNLFGNIQAHEAICAVGRESLVIAIETAHELGFKVFAANVDSLFVHKEGAAAPQDFRPLIAAINHRTGLIIELEGIFDWLVFTASKLNPQIGAANRYFGKFDHGGLKVRGMAQRRSDTPAWIADAEREIMALLASEADAARLLAYVPEIVAKTRRNFSDLDSERVPLEDLVCRNKLTKELHEYTGSSPAAKAAKQLAAAGKKVRVGQRVDFIYTHGKRSAVYAWDQPVEPDYALVSKGRYKELLLRAVHQILAPLGIAEEELADLAYDEVRQLELWPDRRPWDQALSEPEEILSLAEVLFSPFLSAGGFLDRQTGDGGHPA